MKLTFPSLLFVFLLLACVAALPANAQQKRFELAVGIEYTLVGQTFDIDPGLGYTARFDWRIKPRWAIGLVYDKLKTTDDIAGNDFDVDLTVYGVRGTFAAAGEPAFQLILLGGLGTGKLDYNNPKINDPRRPDSTDLSYWYDVGCGVQWLQGDRWNFRVAFTVRGYEPSDKSLLLKSQRAAFVPTFDIGLRF